MPIVMSLLAWAALLLALPATANTAEPMRQIGVYVQPIYEAARTPDGKPQVSLESNTTIHSARTDARTFLPRVP